MKKLIFTIAVVLSTSVSHASSEGKTAADLNQEYKVYQASLGSVQSKSLNNDGTQTVCYSVAGCIHVASDEALRRTFFDTSAGPLNRYTYKCEDGFTFYYEDRTQQIVHQLINEEGRAVTCDAYVPA